AAEIRPRVRPTLGANNPPDNRRTFMLGSRRMNPAAPPLLTTLLAQVSRSFYTTLRVLPLSVRPQIGLAYLLARATDTIADTTLVPVGQRLEALNRWREALLGQAGAHDLPDFTRLA